jgi:hypothetical protein
MLYYLYNDYREQILFDMNSKLRSDAIKCKKIKLSKISMFDLNKLNDGDLLIITGCSVPSSAHNFRVSCEQCYEQLLLSFDKKVILFEDIHGRTYHSYSDLFLDLIKYNIKYGVSMYDCDEWNYIKTNYDWDETFILNHHYDSNTFYNMNLKKDIDILLYGDIGAVYPLRIKIREILKSMTELNIKIVTRADYTTQNGLDSVIEHRQTLSNLINRSHICIATCSEFNYFLCKYLEIVASNSAVAGNIESIGKQIFQGNFIELSLNMSSNEIKQKLIDGLKHKSDLKQMNENVYKNISNFSIQDNYWDNLKIIVNKIEFKLNDDEYIAFNNGWSKKENIMISLGETYLKKSKLHSKDTDPNKLIKVLSGEQVKYIRRFDRNYSVVTQIHNKI